MDFEALKQKLYEIVPKHVATRTANSLENMRDRVYSLADLRDRIENGSIFRERNIGKVGIKALCLALDIPYKEPVGAYKIHLVCPSCKTKHPISSFKQIRVRARFRAREQK